MRYFSALALCILVLSVAASPSFAHKVIASVYASGDMIEGEVGMSNGDMAADAVVEVFDASGNKLGETKTDEDGMFVFKPAGAFEHVFRANLGAGHVAEARMPVDELPTSVAGGAPASTASTPVQTQASSEQSAPVSVWVTENAIRTAVQDAVKPLRKEIAAYKEKHDLQSILGGIGYIFGLFGVGFYVAARRRLKSAS